MIERSRIYLTTADSVLANKYAQSAKHVHVFCDSTDGAFTVMLPDLRDAQDKEFVFKNFGPNTVTVQAASGQYIDYPAQRSHTLQSLDSAGFVSDMKTRWALNDINSLLKSGWDENHLTMGAYHLWIDASGRLRIKSSAPSSATDGTIVGTQS